MTTRAPMSLVETVNYLAAGRFAIEVRPGDPRIFVARRGGPWPVTATLRRSVAAHREALHLTFGVVEVLAMVTTGAGRPAPDTPRRSRPRARTRQGAR